MSLDSELENLSETKYFKQHDLTKLTTMRLNSVGDFVQVESIDALKIVLILLQKYSRKFLMLGWGANQILPASCPELIIQLKFPFDQSYLDEAREDYILPASIGLNSLTAHAVKFGIKGWEVFTGVPASLGGALYMNAGTALGEIGKIVKEVMIVTSDGFERTEFINEKSFSYRQNNFLRSGEVIVGARLVHLGIDSKVSTQIKEYLEYRKATQPLATKNCGCVFKNPAPGLPAGKLIDQMALKNLQVGGLKVSSKHGNFIENIETASWDHFQTITKIIQAQMNTFYGIEFELEVKIPYH